MALSQLTTKTVSGHCQVLFGGHNSTWLRTIALFQEKGNGISERESHREGPVVISLGNLALDELANQNLGEAGFVLSASGWRLFITMTARMNIQWFSGTELVFCLDYLIWYLKQQPANTLDITIGILHRGKEAQSSWEVRLSSGN